MLSLSSGKMDKWQSMLCNSTAKLRPNIRVEIFLLRFLTKSWKIHFLVQGSLRPTSPLKGSFRALGISCGSGGSGVGRSVKRSATSYRRSKNSLIVQIIKYYKILIQAPVKISSFLGKHVDGRVETSSRPCHSWQMLQMRLVCLFSHVHLGHENYHLCCPHSWNQGIILKSLKDINK